MRPTMHPDDARLFFPIEEGVDPEDRYDELLFEQKQYFLSSIPWTKTFEARISKLEKMQSAYVQLYAVNSGVKIPEYDLDMPNQSDIESVYKTYQKNKTQIYLRINQSSGFNELIIHAKHLLKNRKNYALYWQKASLDLSGEYSIRELDPVELLRELESLKVRGVTSFEQVCRIEKQNPVYQEGIQLSLWLNKETNG